VIRETYFYIILSCFCFLSFKFCNIMHLGFHLQDGTMRCVGLHNVKC
jgi:hypothetical protein